MNEQQARQALRKVQARGAELDTQITAAETELRRAEALAAELVGDSKFEAALDKVPRAAARVAALKAAREKVSRETTDAARGVIEARKNDALQEADRLEREVHDIHRAAMTHLNKLGTLLQCDFPLGLLFGPHAVSDDETLNPRQLPASVRHFAPRTCQMMDEITRLRGFADNLGDTDTRDREADAILKAAA